jgi:hypothetical protein
MNKYDAELGATVPMSSQIRKRRITDDSKLELAQTINNSHEVLHSARTVFPFTLFPDMITLDRAKLTITHKDFFWVGEDMSIRIEDILNVTADIGPFFGSLKVYTRFFSTEKPYTVNFLYRRDALRIKRVLQGYIIALQKKLNLSTLPTQQLAHLLEDLGS